MRGPREHPVVTWPLFWLTLGVALLLSLLDKSNVDSLGTAMVNAVVVVASVLAMFAVMWLAEPVVMRAFAGHRMAGVVVLLVIGGLVRAPVLSALLQATGVSDARWAYRALSSLLLFTPLLAFAVSVITLLRENAARRADFEADAERLSNEENDARARTDAYRARAVNGIRSLLAERLTTLRAAGAAASLGPRLRADVDDVIRPLSHHMAAKEAGGATVTSRPRAPRVRWADVWRAGLLGRPIRPGVMAAMMGVGSLVSLVWYSGSLAWGVVSAVVAGLLVLAVMWLLRGTLQGPLRTLPPTRRAVVFTVSVAAGLAVPAIALALLLQASGSASAWRIPITFAVVGVVFAWLVALDQGLRQQVAATGSEMVARTAQLQRAAATAQTEAYHEERRLSRALHGPVQAAVTSAAMRVEAGDTAGAEQLLLDAIGHLDTGAGDDRGVARALGDITAAWDGLCAVDVEVEPDAERAIDADPPLASSVIDICTEACSNAVRHGDAEHITVVARRSGDALDLMVQDDGAPGDAAAMPGLGSAMLDDVTLHWERRREGSRTVLRATLPCR